MEDDWQIVQPEAAVDPGADAVKSAAAKGTLGFLSDIPAIPGMVGDLIQKGVLAAGHAGVKATMGEDAANKFSADVKRGLLEGTTPEERKSIEEGKAIRSAEMGTIPTPYGMETTVKENLPYTQYEPKTPLGKTVGEVSRFAAGSALGPGETLIPRMLEGAVAGAGSEAAGQYAQHNFPEYETYARFAGSMLAPGAAKKGISGIKPFVMPGQFADETALKLLAQDIRMGQSAMTIDQINEAIANGAQPSVIDMAGPKTREWIAKRYGVSNETMDAVSGLNDTFRQRAAEARGNVHGYIEQLYPDLPKMKFEDDVLNAQNKEVKDIYDASKVNPASQSMWTPELEALSHNGIVKDAMDEVYKDFRSNRIPSAWGVNPPSPGMRPNLQYWDQVKKQLDAEINRYKPNSLTNTGNQRLYDAAIEAKKQLTAQLDAMVPEYAQARNAHAELLGFKSAPDAGAALAKARTSSDINELMDVYSKYNDTQKEFFRRGLIRSFYDEIGNPTGSTSSFVKKLTAPTSQDSYRAVLGDDYYNTIVGRATAEDIMAKAKAINNISDNKFLLKEGMKAAAITGVGQLATLITHGDISLTSPAAIASGLAALGKVGGDYALNYAERRVAPEVITLMRSSDPRDIAKFGELVAKNPDAGSFVSKLGDAMAKTPMRYLQSERGTSTQDADQWEITPAPENYDAIPAQADGGRVARKSGGRIKGNPISAEVRKVRALLAEKTASMLSMPDDAIATALHIAKRS